MEILNSTINNTFFWGGVISVLITVILALVQAKYKFLQKLIVNDIAVAVVFIILASLMTLQVIDTYKVDVYHYLNFVALLVGGLLYLSRRKKLKKKEETNK